MIKITWRRISAIKIKLYLLTTYFYPFVCRKNGFLDDFRLSDIKSCYVFHFSHTRQIMS